MARTGLEKGLEKGLETFLYVIALDSCVKTYYYSHLFKSQKVHFSEKRSDVFVIHFFANYLDKIHTCVSFL